MWVVLGLLVVFHMLGESMWTINLNVFLFHSMTEKFIRPEFMVNYILKRWSDDDESI